MVKAVAPSQPDQPEQPEFEEDLSPKWRSIYTALQKKGASREEVLEAYELAGYNRAKTLLSHAKLSSYRPAGMPKRLGTIDWPELSRPRMERYLEELIDFTREKAPGSITDASFNDQDNPKDISLFGEKVVRLYGIALALLELSELKPLEVSFTNNLNNAARAFLSLFNGDFKYVLDKMEKLVKSRPFFVRLVNKIATANVV